MKKITLSLLSAVFAASLITSCTVEKRLHNKGFHVSWNKKVKSSNSNSNEEKETTLAHVWEEESVSENKKTVQASRIEAEDHVASIRPASDQPKEMYQDEVFAEDYSTSASSEEMAFEGDFSEESITFSNETESASENKATTSTTQVSKDGGGSGGGGLTAIGWVLIVLGIIILIFASIILGLILMLGGLAFVIGGNAVKNRG